MEKAYSKWLCQRKVNIEEVGFDPIHPFFAGWTIGFEDGVFAYKSNISLKNIMFLTFGIGLGSLI
jgi:hypothetical protein